MGCDFSRIRNTRQENHTGEIHYKGKVRGRGVADCKRTLVGVVDVKISCHRPIKLINPPLRDSVIN